MGFNPIDLIMSKEELMTKMIIKSFPGVKVIKRCFAFGYRTDLYFANSKLATEIDEKRHSQGDFLKKKRIEKKN